MNEQTVELYYFDIRTVNKSQTGSFSTDPLLWTLYAARHPDIAEVALCDDLRPE